MRLNHVISGAQPPTELSVLGESVWVFGQGDASKPFEVHIQEGRRGGGPPPHLARRTPAPRRGAGQSGGYSS